jgi:hypothetical protein
VVFAPAPRVYPALRGAAAAAQLAIASERLWIARPILAGVPLAAFEERFLPRVIDDLLDRRSPEQGSSVDLNLTLILEKR